MIDFESILKKFGTNFRCLVSEKDITQTELARLLDTSQASVSKWFNGKCFPDTNNLINIADLFGVTVSELIGEVDKEMDEIPRYEFNGGVLERKPVIDKEELEAMELLHNRGIIDDAKYYGYITEKLKEIAE